MEKIDNSKKLYPLYKRQMELQRELSYIQKQITELEKVRYRTTADILKNGEVIATIPFICEVLDTKDYKIWRKCDE